MKYVSQVILGKGVKTFIDHLVRLKIDQFSTGRPAETLNQRQGRRVKGAVCDYPGGSILRINRNSMRRKGTGVKFLDGLISANVY